MASHVTPIAYGKLLAEAPDGLGRMRYSAYLAAFARDTAGTMNLLSGMPQPMTYSEWDRQSRGF